MHSYLLTPTVLNSICQLQTAESTNQRLRILSQSPALKAPLHHLPLWSHCFTYTWKVILSFIFSFWENDTGRWTAAHKRNKKISGLSLSLMSHTLSSFSFCFPPLAVNLSPSQKNPLSAALPPFISKMFLLFPGKNRFTTIVFAESNYTLSKSVFIAYNTLESQISRPFLFAGQIYV